MTWRRVRIPVSYGVLEQWMMSAEHWRRRVESDVPADLRIVGVTDDPYRGVAYLHCESETFQPVPEGSTPPEWTPTFRVVETAA